MCAVTVGFTPCGFSQLIQRIIAVSGFRHDFLIAEEAGGLGIIMDGKNITDRVIIVAQILQQGWPLFDSWTGSFNADKALSFSLIAIFRHHAIATFFPQFLPGSGIIQ
ncbi:Uncharacterised protein [Yersinia enterocolitica]|nr:hypothetical protein DJ62_4175 [Yersinia enterocolitica]CNC79464.1 Uncharacterised protein [Yersinia enterocolitica]CNI11106.1 Uncharacterised protein [Yersinia enterocolitica]CQI04284.1 Uncharacterised protein [Yersinia enterocolitica]CQI08870.1 Uncharacterised protein [Yersinia enterocolitica]